MNRVGAFLCSSVFLFLFLGCESPPVADFQWVDSAGVQILAVPMDLPIPQTDLSAAPQVVVTGNEDDPIGNLRGLIWVDSSRVALADNDMTIRVYRRNGARLATLGGSGSGPGEFRDILWLDRAGGGAFAAYDPVQNRLSLFGPDLTFSRSITPLVSLGTFVDWRTVLHGSVGLVGVGLVPEAGPGRTQPPALWGHNPVILFLGDEQEDHLIDTMALHRCKEDVSERCAPEGWGGNIDAWGGEVYITPLDWPEIREYSADGDLLQVIRFTDPTGGGFAQLIVDHQGRVWVSREAESFWTVFDLSALRVSRYLFPESFRLRDIWESTALGVQLDSLRIQRVALVELHPEQG
jgi:hypothetical protein